MGYSTEKKDIFIKKDELLEVNFVLKTEAMAIDEVVVTGTKTFKRQTAAAVIVNVIDSKLLAQTQSCNIAEGLRFQPGLRVETDCQTCNYTHFVFMGSADYQVNFNQENSSFIAYLAGQQTNRKHYTGIVPDDSADILVHMFDPPYG